MKVDFDYLKLYILNSWATTKEFKRGKNKPIAKKNIKNTQPKSIKKREKRSKNRWNILKTISKLVDFKFNHINDYIKCKWFEQLKNRDY